MFKRWLCIALCISVLLGCMPAMAQKVLPTEDGNALYIEQDGRIYDASGLQRTSLPAQKILWAGQGRTVYLNKTEAGVQRIVHERTDGRVNIYAGSVAQAVYSAANGLLYYTKPEDASVIYRCSPLFGVSLRACVMPGDVVQLTPSQMGLIIVCQSDEGDVSAWLLPKEGGEPELYDAVQEHLFPGCSVQVLAGGGMRILFEGMEGAEQTVADTPIALCMYGNELFYLKKAIWGDTVQLMRYRTDEMRKALIGTVKTPVRATMATDGGYIYLVSTADRLLVHNAQTGAQALSLRLPSVPADPELIVQDNTLYVYDTLEDGSAALLSAYTIHRSLIGVSLLKQPAAAVTPSPTPSPTPVPTPTPTPQPILLKRGMRGDDVRLMQEALIELGYLDDRADGSFGSKTLRAVKLFQEAIGQKETGMADNALLERLYAEDAPVFDLYAPLSQGDEGLRVRDLQNELYKKGYIAEAADGAFGSKTAAAVKRLQAQLGLRQTGVMSATCMEYVYNGNMPVCTSYFTLRLGDSGLRVEQLQRRLGQLGYFTGAVSGVYDDATYQAVCLFEVMLGAAQTGRAGVNMQTYLYSDSAPVFGGTLPTPAPTPVPTPKPTPTPAPTVDPNVIGPDSPYDQVLWLQQMLHALGKIGAADVTGVYNSATKYAIGYIQIDMRDNYGYSGMKSTGRADLATQDFIYSMFVSITPPPATPVPVITEPPVVTPEPIVTPEPVVTPEPIVTPEPVITPEPVVTPEPQAPVGEVINASSSREVVFAAQQKLYAIGYMTDPVSVSGVYDEETKNCVYFFQRDLNDYFGQNIAKTGHIDEVTKKFLDEMYVQNPKQDPPVVMGDVVQNLCDMLNAFEAELSPHFEPNEPRTSVKWAQKILQKWGYFPADYKPDSVYDQQMFDIVSVLRADLSLADPLLIAEDPALTGVIDEALFVYFKQMHLTDPAAIPEGSSLAFKTW